MSANLEKAIQEEVRGLADDQQPQDLARAADLLEKLADNKVDFVDCAIVAMAERLNLTKVLTVDRRHFTIFRPNHCDYFEISPCAIASLAIQ